MTSEPEYRDVFISYASEDAEVARALRDALDDLGCSVWFDKDEIRNLDPITDRLDEGIERSLLTVALVSENQASSRVCRWEILQSLLLGDARGCDRIDLLHLDETLNAIPASARTRRAIDLQSTSVEDAANQIHGRVQEIRSEHDIGSWNSSDDAKRPVRRGVPGGSGHRYFGRLKELIQIYDALCGSWRYKEAGQTGQRDVCIVHGMGGVGKSILVTFFVEQFDRSFPGGIVWLSAGGDQVDNVASSPEATEETFRRLGDEVLACASEGPVIAIATDTLPVDPRKRWMTLRERVHTEFGHGRRTLLVVDDLPTGIPVKDVCPSSEKVAVLATSRDVEHTVQGAHSVSLQPFDEEEGLLFLASTLDPDRSIRRAKGDPFAGYKEEARQLVDAVGSHPLALDLLAVRIANRGARTIPDLLHEITDQSKRFMDVPGFAIKLPSGHTPSILATISGSLRSLASASPEGEGVVLPMLRTMMVMPAGQAIPLHLMERTAGHEAEFGANLLCSRSVAVQDSDGIRFHALTRTVAQLLWDKGEAPFATCRDRLEPDLSLEVAAWLHATAGESDNVTPTALRLARELIDILDALAAERHGAIGPDQRRQRSDAWLRLARERNRNPALRDEKQLEEACEWAQTAKQGLPRDHPSLEGMQWWQAEAMEALIRNKINGLKMKRGDPKARDQVVEIRDRLEHSAETREAFAVQLLNENPKMDEASKTWIAIQRMNAKGNLPGRYLRLAKFLADAGDIAEQLDLMETTHGDLIHLRTTHAPHRIADRASNHEGLGSVAYHRAVLLAEPRSAKARHLRAAVDPLIESLRLREREANLQDEIDVSKSLRLLLKVAVAATALDRDPGTAREILENSHTTAASEVTDLEPGVYTGGANRRQVREATAVGQYRDAQVAVILDADADQEPDPDALIDACVRWLMVANERVDEPEGAGTRRVTVDAVVNALFGSDDDEIAHMVRTVTEETDGQ